MAENDSNHRDTDVASHRAASALRTLILNSEYPPGYRLRQEELAAALGASRVPIREALHILESEGLVTLKPNSGAWVAKLDLQECDAVYRIRERVEPLVLAESMQHMTPADYDRLHDIQVRIEADGDPEVFLGLDREFHLYTYVGCRIESLNLMVERFWNTTQHYRRAFTQFAMPDRTWVINAEHNLLVDAIRRNDPDRAGSLLAGHIRNTRVELLKHPEIFETGEA
jgi:DNA-binding GntR family transcriptional regulator